VIRSGHAARYRVASYASLSDNERARRKSFVLLLVAQLLPASPGQFKLQREALASNSSLFAPSSKHFTVA
jgi:hypothetical protein